MTFEVYDFADYWDSLLKNIFLVKFIFVQTTHIVADAYVRYILVKIHSIFTSLQCLILKIFFLMFVDLFLRFNCSYLLYIHFFFV